MRKSSLLVPLLSAVSVLRCAVLASSSPSVLSSSLHDFFERRLLHGDDGAGDDGGLAAAWETSPRLWRGVRGVDGDLFSLDDARRGAAGGLLGKVAVARGADAAAGSWASDALAVGTRRELDAALDRGTVFLNGAGLDYPRLAALAGLSQRALGLPANVNAYLTAPGRDVSVPAHTDAQNVLVLQTQGRKRWRVWAPPPRGAGDPFGRGKNGDRIAAAELGPPLLDAWLEPGAVLYVPMGFPHATSTAAAGRPQEGRGADAPSCHVTLGVDAYFYGLTYTTLRALALARAGARDAVDPRRVDEASFSRLFAALPCGFLGGGASEGEAWTAGVVAELRAIDAGAAASCGVAPARLGTDEEIAATLRFLMDHRRAIIDDNSKYRGVTDPPPANTVESVQARALRNAKNQRELALQQKLWAFAKQ